MSARRHEQHEQNGSAKNSPRAPHSLKGGSSHANRLAVAILEVLTGLRTPTDAAEALGISLPRYYQLEVRALEGLVAACESRKKGRQLSPEARIKKLEEELTQAQSECARQQALVRAAQRTIGLRAPVTPKAKLKSSSSSRRRKRRPTVRALKAVQALRSAVGEEAAKDKTTDIKTDLPAAGRTIDAGTADARTTTGSKP
jgi:hypothetical protein